MRHNRAGKWMRRWDNRKYLTTHEELPVDNGTIWCPKITIQRGKLRTVPGNCVQTHPLDVPVYWSVQEAPFGHTFPMRVQKVRSVDVLISIPTAVAFKRTQSELQKTPIFAHERLTKNEIFARIVLAHGWIMNGCVTSHDTRANDSISEGSKWERS